jgi:hypothetical protein
VWVRRGGQQRDIGAHRVADQHHLIAAGVCERVDVVGMPIKAVRAGQVGARPTTA